MSEAWGFAAAVGYAGWVVAEDTDVDVEGSTTYTSTTDGDATMIPIGASVLLRPLLR